MAQVHINNVVVLNNPAPIKSQIHFQVTFQCFKELPGTFNWKLTYLGSPKDSKYDQTIEDFDMNQLPVGCLTFNIDSDPPDFSKIPPEEIVGTTAILISTFYEGQEFFRVGYYVVNEYMDNSVQPPLQPQLDKIVRRIISDKPRIMRFEIEWTKQQGNSGQNQYILQQNLAVIGEDPFQQSNGVFNQLDKLNYSYGMFGPGSQN